MRSARRPYRLFDGTLDTLAAPGPGRMIVTPNLDHLRLLACSKALRRAYACADVVLNDSRFLDRAFYRGQAFCLTGADLAPQMLARLPTGARVLVIGSTPAIEAALRGRWPGLDFTFRNPSMGYIARRAERRTIAAEAVAMQPDCIFVCTGAPQSELFAAQLKRAGVTADMLCCGSGLLFLAGASKRAPTWARKLGGEWLFRFLHEPRTRRRYAMDALFLVRSLPAFLGLRRTGAARFGRFAISCG